VGLVKLLDNLLRVLLTVQVADVCEDCLAVLFELLLGDFAISF
jgi:hypothetical protein